MYIYEYLSIYLSISIYISISISISIGVIRCDANLVPVGDGDIHIIYISSSNHYLRKAAQECIAGGPQLRVEPILRQVQNVLGAVGRCDSNLVAVWDEIDGAPLLFGHVVARELLDRKGEAEVGHVAVVALQKIERASHLKGGGRSVVSIYLSIYLSIYIYIYLSIYMSIYLIYIYIYIYRYIYIIIVMILIMIITISFIGIRVIRGEAEVGDVAVITL